MNATEAGRALSGRYRLSRVIGRGGMGVVWQAHDGLLNRDVAVKELLWPSYFSEREQQQACRRATREAQVAARLSHVNVVRIYDIVEEDGHPWIIMELLPYPSLRDLIEQEGRLSPARSAEIGLGVLAALRAAHAAGILHRDVKPANILVGPDERVVLTDFGIARATDSPTLTTAGALVGSPSYIAPERAKGGQAAAPADMWGLGASLYTAVEGRPPFERNGALPTLTAVVADEPDPASHLGPLLPAISGLLRKDPAERLGPADTERMLRQVAAGEGASPVFRKPWWRKAQSVAVLPSPSPAPEPAPAAPSEPAQPAEPAALPDSPPPASPEPERSASAVPEAAVAAATAEDSEPAAAPGQAPDSPLRVPARAGQTRVGAAERPRRPGRIPAVAILSVLAAAVTVLALVLTRAPRNEPVSTAGGSHAVTRSASSTGSPVPASATALASAAGSPSVTVPATPDTQTSPGSSASAPPHAAGTSPGPAATTPASPAGGSASGGATYGAIPAGWYRFTNSTGFSIGVPDGWRISHVGHYVYVNDPSDGNIYLLIDQSDDPKPDPLADWQQQQANRESTYPDYRLIRLVSVNYPQAEKAADWEFTYVDDGVPVHILIRNILANASHAYALYWSTPAGDWKTDYHYFQTFAATFRPAAASG